MKFAFEAEAWNSAIKRTFNLTKVFRQKDQGMTAVTRDLRKPNVLEQNLLVCSMRCALDD